MSSEGLRVVARNDQGVINAPLVFRDVRFPIVSLLRG